MQVANEKVVHIHYTLKNDQGDVLDSSEGGEPLSYLHGADNIIPGLEKALEGHEPGEEVDVRVPAEDAFGERRPELVQSVPRSQFPPEVTPEVNMQFQAQTPAGPQTVTVVDIDEELVTVDANHPLAGAALNFSAKVLDVRDATAEELEHRHAHGPGGQDH
jgi:FKBP-type peptidyl-prolyl cis-trans isomerase SlyD